MNNSNSSIVSAIQYVSKEKPCVHCGKPDWCYFLGIGASVCNRGSISIDYEDSGKKDKNGSSILYPKVWNKQQPKPSVISKKEWIYYGRNYAELVKVIRQNLNNGKKDMFQNFKGTNGWVKTKPKSLERSDIPIYKLEEIKEAIAQNKTIFIVEGEKCADLFWSMGLAATTNIQGAKNYSDSDIQDFWNPETNSQHQNIVLVPDRDEPGLKLMKQWEKGLGKCEWLYPYPDKDWVNIPASDGLDCFDWITDNLLKVEDIEKNIGVVPDSLNKVVAKTSTPLKQITSYIEDENPDESLDQPEPIILPPSYPYNVRAVKAIYGRGKFISFEGSLYEYTGKHYEKLDPSIEMLKIRSWAEQESIWNGKEQREEFKYLAPHFLKVIWEWALIDHGVSSELINPPGLNLANGTLKLAWKGKTVSWELKKHSHKDYFLFCSAVEFNPEADSEACDRLLEVLDPIPRTVFLRTIAASLDLEPIRELHGRPRALISRGGGSNGKDSVKEAVARIFTSSLICSCPFTDFSAYDMGRKFDLTKLKNKKINWASENNRSTVLDVGDALNAAISGEELDFEKKGKDSEKLVPTCIHIFNVNKMPKIKSGLDSIKTRFAVLDFNKTFASKPDPSKGELFADPRFKYSPQFVTEEVCPALLNRILAELTILAKEGIDYEGIASSFEDIQEDSNHLWSFVKDSGIIPDPNGKIYVKEFWEVLKNWYIENETLEIRTRDNEEREIWHDQSNKYDRNITRSNQLYARFKELFPKIKTDRETRAVEKKGSTFIQGIAFSTNPLHRLHHSDTASLSTSPSTSLDFTPLHPIESNSEVKYIESEVKPIESEVKVKSLVKSKPALGANGEVGEVKMIKTTAPLDQGWRPITEIGLENLYMGDWIALSDGAFLKLGRRTKKFWYATPENSTESLEIPFSEIQLVFK